MSQPDLIEPADVELLAGHVLGDLSETEVGKVECLLAENDGAVEMLSQLEATAAGVQLALLGRGDVVMPKEVADHIRGAGIQFLESQVVASGDSTRLDSERLTGRRSAAPLQQGGEPVILRAVDAGAGAKIFQWGGWLCAAAAMLMAMALWQHEPAEVMPREGRAALLRDSRSLIRIDWTAGKTPFDQPVLGDVVWDPSSQTGYMRFENMPPNDPTLEQYQLWIIDPARDDEPIDGGVFDIAESGEVVVAIDAKLNVISPAAFAITIEKPGGVVVSTQERLPLLAAVAR